MVIVRALIDLLAPPVCVACGGPAGAGLAVLCVPCRGRLPWLANPCPRCALPRTHCPPAGRCPAARAPWDAAWSPLAHDGPARDLVRALKFRGALDAATVMAAHLAAGAPAGLLRDEGAVLVPVPADPGRRRRRGFDHAALLAMQLGRRTGLPVVDALARTGPRGARQLGAGRAERLAEGRVAVTLRGPAPPAAILVDDVHTTGATFAACAAALVAGGTRRTVVISHTRTLP